MPSPTAPFTRVDSRGGDLEHRAARRCPTWATKSGTRKDTFPVAPNDTQQDIRTEMCLVMEQLGIKIERQHHEVATGGQAEIDFRFDTLVKTADNMMLYKYVIKNIARKHGKTATFMPKPLFGDNGSGMHTHQSLWKKGKPLFAGKEYAGLSQMALYYIGGILKHAKALCAIVQPDDQLLQAPGARLRSAGQPGLQRAQPQRGHPHPDLQRKPQGQAHRVSSAGPVGQPVSVLTRRC